MLARSEAIRRGGGIGMRKFGNEPGGCQNAGTNQEWGCGWFIYEDVNGNGSWNKTQDRILHELRLTGSVNVIHNSGGVNIKFDRYGKASGLNAKGFKFLPERTGTQSSYAQTLCMSSGEEFESLKTIVIAKMKIRNLYQQGITLLESLIAIIVIALGVLGILGMQMRTLNNTQNSLYRTQAIRLIDDLSERIAANPNALLNIENI